MQIEAYVVTPRVMSRAAEIPGVLVILGALIGGTLMGFLGALVAIPVTAAILLIIKHVAMPLQDSKTLPDHRPPRRAPGSEREAAVDELARHHAEAHPVRPGVVAHERERLVDRHAAGLRDHALRLFDDDPAVERRLKLLREHGALADGALVQDADGRDIRERLRGVEILTAAEPRSPIA